MRFLRILPADGEYLVLVPLSFTRKHRVGQQLDTVAPHFEKSYSPFSLIDG